MSDAGTDTAAAPPGGCSCTSAKLWSIAVNSKTPSEVATITWLTSPGSVTSLKATESGRQAAGDRRRRRAGQAQDVPAGVVADDRPGVQVDAQHTRGPPLHPLRKPSLPCPPTARNRQLTALAPRW